MKGGGGGTDGEKLVWKGGGEGRDGSLEVCEESRNCRVGSPKFKHIFSFTSSGTHIVLF